MCYAIPFAFVFCILMLIFASGEKMLGSSKIVFITRFAAKICSSFCSRSKASIFFSNSIFHNFLIVASTYFYGYPFQYNSQYKSSFLSHGKLAWSICALKMPNLQFFEWLEHQWMYLLVYVSIQYIFWSQMCQIICLLSCQ